MPTKTEIKRKKKRAYYLRMKERKKLLTASPSFDTLVNWTRFSNYALEAIANGPEHHYMEPLSQGEAPHLAILEPYCNLHITSEDGVTSFLTILNEKGNKEVKLDIKKEGIVCEEGELEKCEMVKKEVISYPESSDPLSSGVAYINIKVEEEPDEEDEKEMEEIEEEENEIKMKGIWHEVSLCEDKEEELEKCIVIKKEVSCEEDEPISINEPVTRVSAATLSLLCLSVRIGSFKVYPMPPDCTLTVFLSMDGISFYSPIVTDGSKSIKITIKHDDITHMLVHFGCFVPILFVITTPNFAEAVRRSLNMCNTDLGFYDPTSTDEKMNKITFLLGSNVKHDQCEFLRHCFKLTELNKQTANELLVKSTP